MLNLSFFSLNEMRILLIFYLKVKIVKNGNNSAFGYFMYFIHYKCLFLNSMLNIAWVLFKNSFL